MSKSLRIGSLLAVASGLFLGSRVILAVGDGGDLGTTNLSAEVPSAALSAEAPTNPPAAPIPDPALARLEPAVARLEPAVEALASRLKAIENSLSLQHQRSLEAGQESSRMILTVAGCFAGAALLGALLAALILSRAMRRVSEVVAAALPSPRLLTAGSMSAGGMMATSAGMDLSTMQSGGSVELVTTRFLGVIEQLEKRIVELEHSAHVSDGPARGNGNGKSGAHYEFSVSALQQKQYPDSVTADGVAADPVASWLGKGQALLGLGQAAEALACFDKAVELAPGSADAQVKRGLALEKLERLEEALGCFDKAIAADPGFTLAYLYKGGVCNRLQRYREAVECYESALKSEQKPVAK